MTPEQLIDRIKARAAKVGVIGLGYVGLPLAMEFARQGFSVLGLDIDKAKTDRLARGESYIGHIPSERVAEMLAGGRFEATADFSRACEPDALIICVPTPLTKNREPDLSYIEKTGEAIAPRLRRGQIVILESTTYPGTTDEVLLPILETSGLKVGSDFLLAYSPEREDPGNPEFSTAKIPKVVGGYDAASLAAADALYGQIVVRTVPVSSTRAAEASKLTENIFRCVNIALVNELKLIYDRMGIDVWEVIEAAKTKPFGFMPFYPGPGLGGHCIPIDPFYLSWKARAHDCTARFIELAGEINTAMPAHVIDVLMNALNGRRKSLNGSRVLILGLAYKKDVDDLRESPSLRLMDLLREKGAEVDYHDPFIPVVPPTREHPEVAGMKSVAWDLGAIGRYDAVLISTAHTKIDYAGLMGAAQLIVDSRNAMSGIEGPAGRVVKA